MTTIAIGLDSACPKMIEELIASGELPAFENLRKRGAYGRLENFDIFTAELPWTTFATGVMPEKTGYWTPLKYTPDYTVHTRAAYEFDEYPAFFSLGTDYRVCSFDVPQVRLQDNLNGWQFNAWGAHSPQVAQESNVPDIYRELVRKHGKHPGLHADYAHALDMKQTRKVYDMLMEGIRRRGDICADLIQRERWDLFLTVFGEPHGAGHNFWQFEPDHPLFGRNIPGRELLPERPMRNILMAIDAQLQKFLDVCPEDSQFVIYSAHGMGPNTMDLPSLCFLPEFMYRWSFGRAALGQLDELNSEWTCQAWGSWARHLWNTADVGGPLVKMARRYLPSGLYNRLAERWEYRAADFPMHPILAAQNMRGLPNWQPAAWYSNCWPSMKAFALMSFSEGYVRINVRGRETDGMVEPADYRREIEDICTQLRELRCARTGRRMVKKTVITREDPLDPNPKLPDADIVISWQESFASDAVEHPEYGRIGPVPHFRSGSHRHEGFILLSGPAVEAGRQINNGHALDIAPTILAMVGAGKPEYMEGTDLGGVLSASPVLAKAH